jgi:mannose-1-phosphate guanylyltransferase/mannose-6-phosphate isomerase
LVRQQANDIGVELGPIVMEPFGRNTAACGVVAARLGQQAECADAVLMVPADHHITQPDAFIKTVRQAVPLTQDGYLVTFGITPTHPHTGFGYIERGASRGAGHLIQQFHEKPSLETAKDYLQRGSFYWNAGIFLFGSSALLSEFETHAPDVLNTVDAAIRKDGGSFTINADAFTAVPDISFDCAIAECTEKAAVLGADIGWSDIGSYAALFDLRESVGQVPVTDTAIVESSENVFIVSDMTDVIVSVAGLSNVGIIIQEGRILVVNLEKDQTVKSVVQSLPDAYR